MMEVLERIVSLGWRRSGASIRQVQIAGSCVWYAEFQPRNGAAAARAQHQRRGRGAPTIVLLHGLGASSISFYTVIDELRRLYRVVVPDLPGYGLSRPPEGKDFLTFPELVDVAEGLLARVAPHGCYLAGNSMGGWIGAKVASRRADLVRGLALLNPGGPALRAEDWVDFARIMMLEERGAMGEWLRRSFYRPPLALRVFAHDVRQAMKRPCVTLLMATLRAEDFISEEELRRVRCPAVLVWGQRDHLIPDGCRSFYLEHLRGVRYEPVPECGHCPQLERPHRTAEILLELPRIAIRRVPARPAAAGGRPLRAPLAPRPRGGVMAVARAPRA